MDDLLEESERKMNISLDHLRAALGKLRTGRASLMLVEDIKVDYYGNPTPLNQVSALAVPDSATITIQPWDAAVLPQIEKAIQASDLGLNPSNDGKLIRLVLPPLTSERRQQLVKIVKKNAEECRVAIRNLRRDFNEKFSAKEKKGEISKDENHRVHEKNQKLTDKYIAETDKIAQAKEKDVLEV